MERNTNEQNTIEWLKQKYGDDIDAKLTSTTVDTKLKMDIECNLKDKEFYVQVKSFTWYSVESSVKKLQETIRLLLQNDKYVEHHEKLQNAKFAIYRNRDGKFLIENFVNWDTDPKDIKKEKKNELPNDDITPTSYALERIKELKYHIKKGNLGTVSKYHNTSPMSFSALFNKSWEQISKELGDDIVQQLEYHFEYWANLGKWFDNNKNTSTSRKFYEFKENDSALVKDETMDKTFDYSQIITTDDIKNDDDDKGGNDIDDYIQ